jgi:hypothetical protein
MGKLIRVYASERTWIGLTSPKYAGVFHTPPQKVNKILNYVATYNSSAVD